MINEDVFVQNNICVVPFLYLNVRPNGDVLPCTCGGYLKKMITVGNILHNTFDEIWTNKEFQRFRNYMYEGKIDDICSSSCPHVINLKKKKASSIMKFADEKLVSEVQNKKTLLDSPYRAVIVQSDTSCNLACTMCRTGRILKPTEMEGKVDEIAIKQIADNISKLKWLRISANGEVFFKKSTRLFLNMLQQKNLGHLTISFITNGTLLNEKKWSQIENLHPGRLEIFVSIDAGTKETYEKIRKFGDWDKLVNNMNMLGQKRAVGSLNYFAISFVVMKSNIQDMPNFVKLGKSWNCDNVIFKRISDTIPTGDPENFFKSKNGHCFKTLSKNLNDPLLNDPRVIKTTLDIYKDFD